MKRSPKPNPAQLRSTTKQIPGKIMKVAFLVTTATVLGAAVAAHAADTIGPVDAPASHAWSGIYIGVHGGGAWLKADDSVDSVNLHGPALGAYAGANWQSNNFVFGLEADVTHPWSNGDIYGLELDVEWQASLRVRLGYAMDRLLIYGAGGVATSRVKVDATPAFVVKDTFTGWTLGGGAEYALNQNWTTRLEYRYSDYGSSGFGLGIGEFKLTGHALRVGVGYKF